MKNIVKSMLPVVAVIVIVGATQAFAQAPASGGQVPFEFKAGNTAMPAGNYVVTAHNTDSAAHSLAIRNRADTSTVLVNVVSAIYNSNDTRPRMIFRCSSDGCQLRQVFTGASGWEVAAPKHIAAEDERLSTVYLSGKGAGN